MTVTVVLVEAENGDEDGDENNNNADDDNNTPLEDLEEKLEGIFNK
jgi:hypothetical protein